jgi:NAD(P)-dependent dehydrogenase (short-subunit alcohol dehydrogenase family)
MKVQGTGAVVNVTSGAGMGVADTCVYGASKGAVSAYTYDLAIDVRSSGIRVNAVSPLAETRMQPPKPLPGALPQPDSIAPLVVYLLSDLARDVTGQILRLNGSALSVVSAPRVLPAVVRASWTPESIAAEVRRKLAADFQPLGFATEVYEGMP